MANSTDEEIKGRLDEALSYTLLTEEVSHNGAARRSPSSNGSGNGALGGVVENAVREVLGWRPRDNDPRGFVAALNQAFEISEVDGHTEFKWTPRSYAVQADLGAVTGAQAAIYTRAKAAVDQSIPLLEGLTSLRSDSDNEDAQASRALVRERLNELVNELGQVGGPRIQRVDTIFRQLLGKNASSSRPEEVGGLLGALGERLGLERNRVNTIDEEQNLTNFLILVDHVFSIRNTWQNQQRFFARTPGATDVFLGTHLVLLSRALEVVAEAVQEVYFAMDSVFLGPAERQTIEINEGKPGQPHLTIAELLSWAERFATEEGVRMIQDGGKDGVIAMQPTLNLLTQLVQAAANLAALPAHNPTPAFHSRRVGRALTELAAHLETTRDLAAQIRRDPDPDPKFVDPPDSFANNTVTLAIDGAEFQDGAQVYLLSNDGTATRLNAKGKVVFISATRLRAAFDLSHPKAQAGEWDVVVVNPDGGAGTLAEGFTICEPPFGPFSIEPQSRPAGGGDFTLRISGPRLRADTLLYWEGKKRPVTFDAVTKSISFTVPAAEIASAGLKHMELWLPGQPGSVDVNLPVENPKPVLDRLDPPTLPAGTGKPLPVMLHGAGFVVDSLPTVNDVPLKVLQLDPHGSFLEVEIPDTATLSPGKLRIAVENPGPGGGRTRTRRLTVSGRPAPTSSITIKRMTPGKFNVSAVGGVFSELVVIYGDNLPDNPQLTVQVPAAASHGPGSTTDVQFVHIDPIDDHLIEAEIEITSMPSHTHFELVISDPSGRTSNAFPFDVV